MTDKATVEIPSPVAGKVLALGGKAGEVDGGRRRADPHRGRRRGQRQGAGGIAGAAQPCSRTEAAPAAAGRAPLRAAVGASAHRVRVARRSRHAAPRVSRRRTPLPRPRAPPATHRGADAVTRAVGDKPIASPAVRSRAWDLGIDLQYVTGSGPAGAIMHEDLDAYLAARKAGRRHGAPPAATRATRSDDDEEAIPVIGLRRKIAQKMQDVASAASRTSATSRKSTSPSSKRCARTSTRSMARQPRQAHLAAVPACARWCVAVRDFPQINARLRRRGRRRHAPRRRAPRHRHADRRRPDGAGGAARRARDLWASAAEIARLADARAQRQGAREELTGSTITITSLGALGGIVTHAGHQPAGSGDRRRQPHRRAPDGPRRRRS